MKELHAILPCRVTGTKPRSVQKANSYQLNTEVKLAGFLTPKLYGHYAWRVHIVDPFDFFDEPLKSKLLALNVRKVKPFFGRIDYDVDGRLIGNWFLEGSGGYPGDRRDPRGYCKRVGS